MTGESIDWVKGLKSSGSLYEETVAELHAFILKSLTKGMLSKPGVNAEFLEDVTQDALIKILSKIDTFEGRSKFTSWALSIAIRVAFSEFRKKQWNNVSLEHLMDQGKSFEERSQVTPYSSAVLSGAVKTLHSLIETRLSELQRKVLTAELHGMPQDEIAEQLGTNRNAIYKVGHDSRKILKRELQRAGYDQEAVLEILNR